MKLKFGKGGMGAWLFLIAIALVLLVALLNVNIPFWAFALIGLVVLLLNVKGAERKEVAILGGIFLLVSTFLAFGITAVDEVVRRIFESFTYFLAPIVVISIVLVLFKILKN